MIILHSLLHKLTILQHRGELSFDQSILPVRKNQQLSSSQKSFLHFSKINEICTFATISIINTTRTKLNAFSHDEKATSKVKGREETD